MKARLDCIPCAVMQGLNTIRHVTGDETVHRRVVDGIVRRLAGVSLDQSPALLSDCVYEVVREVTGIDDPYAEEKRRSNAMALGIVEQYRHAVDASDDPLHTALKLAIMGNLIDMGVTQHIGRELDVEAALAAPFAVDDYDALRCDLDDARLMLYLGDNAGEIAFDRLAVEEIKAHYPNIEVVFAVKSRPIINDAMMDDALQVGMDRVARVIENGSGRIGTDLDDISPELLDLLRHADAVIAKGHGNYETLADAPFNLYFLLRAKCNCVADELGVQVKDAALRRRVGRDAARDRL